MYEHKKQPLAPKKVYYQRVKKSMFLAFLILFLCLFIGTLGYQLTIPKFGWYNSLLNASMILSGMGPMIDSSYQLSNTAKLFASAYALFSGVAFLSTFGLLITPIVHRFFHKMHIEDTN